MIELVTFFLLFLLYIEYNTLGRNFLRPAMLYTGGFFVCSFVAWLYKEEWGLDKMSPITAYLIIGGCIIYYLAELLVYKAYPQNKNYIDISNSNFSQIDKDKFIFFLIFQIASYYLMSRAKITYAMTDDLAEAIGQINNETKFEGESISLPIYIQLPYQICMLARSVWCILLPYYYFKSDQYKWHKILIALNFIAGIIGTFLGGGRTAMLFDIISVSSFWYICYKYKHNWKGSVIPRKAFLIFMSVIFIFGYYFRELGYMMGRSETDNTASIIFTIYCGAEIKNLDDLTKHPSKATNNSEFFGQFTLNRTYVKILPYLTTEKRKTYAPGLHFNSYEGYPLGNVYTANAFYWLDFGFLGILAAGIMSLIVAFIYKNVVNSKFWKTGRLDLWIVYYGTVIPGACFLSFFSNKFFEKVTLQGSIRDLIILYLLILFLQSGNNVNKRLKFYPGIKV